MVYKSYDSRKSNKKQTSYLENPADVIWKELDDVYNEIFKLYKKQKKAKGAGDDIVEKLTIEGEVHELLRKNKKLTKKEIRKVLIEDHDEEAVDDVLKELFK